MSPECAAQVYDFVRFLQHQSNYPSPITAEEDDWLDDREEQMQAEDARWAAAQVRHRDKFASLVAAARAEIDAGTTEPLFTKNTSLREGLPRRPSCVWPMCLVEESRERWRTMRNS
jgi:hypothetical protein